MNKPIYFLLTLTALLIACGKEEVDDPDVEFSATVQITPSTSNVSEDAGSASFTITLSETNTSGSTLSIPFSVSGTATESSDFTIDSSPVTIAINQKSATVDLDIMDDSDEESNETLILTLGNLPDGITAGTNSSASITITDNDAGSSGNFEIFFGATGSSSLTLDSWTDQGADGYVVLINTEDSFLNLTNGDTPYASSTYVGHGQQIIFAATTISAAQATLLESGQEYFFKVVPYTGSYVYDNSLSTDSNTPSDCTTTSTTEGQVCFSYSATVRTISSNQLANHAVGNFPNAVPTATMVTRELDLTPAPANGLTYLYSELGMPTPSRAFWKFGIMSNGVEYHPMGLQPWENPETNEQNWAWQAKVTEQNETNLDAYGAHVTSQGNYHYHGDIIGLADEDGTRHSPLYGFAGDGFPIYYKYGYTVANDPTSAIKELKSSYKLKTGARTGTGTAGEDYPGGDYDGTYIQDFEYEENLGDLDECNGRTGITPEFPDGTYYYVITSDFPVAPNCFYGTPAADWQIGN